ncbi:nitric oxide synthase oxygenase [Nocardia sp. NPDC046763]|uniref:nitric oxide synthase oxygenase n=1 Tax=Nocardia sp. NPDC046763 TaxID=3155256 RepID=UPI0033FD4E8D
MTSSTSVPGSRSSNEPAIGQRPDATLGDFDSPHAPGSDGDHLRECAEFFAQSELAHLPSERVKTALREFRRTGTYPHTPDELRIGARLAWRNHDRCVGRKHWRALEVLDARTARTASDIAQACWQHLRRSTNGGAVRCFITVGPPADPEGRAFRILNSQLIRYAGYRVPGGVLGDPANVELTDLAMDRGWRPRTRGRFDVLPLLIQAPDRQVHLFPVPADLVLEVPLTHPEHAWFGDLGLKWHAVPAVSNMDLQIGGISYPCAPFNGWYVSSEIGRNLGDSDRYDMLPDIAQRAGLDCSNERTLWRDRALVELSRAILHSYKQSRVHLVDHHTVAKQFIDHVEREKDAGRGCPADWSWINPPLSASLTPTFHRYYDPPDPQLRPAFLRRSAPEPTSPPTLPRCPVASKEPTSTADRSEEDPKRSWVRKLLALPN